MGPPKGLPPMGRPVGTTAQRGSNARISWPPGQGKIWGQESRRGPKTKLAETSLANGPGQDARPPGHRHTGCRAPGPKATEKGHVYGPAHSRLQRTVQRALATPGRNRGAEPMGPRHHGAGPPHQRATKKRPRIETRARTAIEGRAARTRQAPAKPQGAQGPAPGGPPETRYGRRALQGWPRETRCTHPKASEPSPGAQRGTLGQRAQEPAPGGPPEAR